MIKRYLIFLVIVLSVATLFSCHTPTSDQGKWTLVFKNDHDGKSLYGSKAELIKAVRSGSPIRVGFGGHRKDDTLRSVEHVAEAQFLTIANSKEVFAQIATNIGQAPDLNADPITMEFREENKFSFIACTNGTFSGLSIDFIIDTLNTTNQNNRGLYWYAPASNVDIDVVRKNKVELIEPLWKNPRK